MYVCNLPSVKSPEILGLRNSCRVPARCYSNSKNYDGDTPCTTVGQSERGTPNGAQPCNTTDFTLCIDIKGPITI